MEIKNYERELKYLIMEGRAISFEEIINIFNSYDYSLVETDM